MKSIYTYIGVFIFILTPVLLKAQTDCNPDAGGGTATSGSLFMNFGSSTNAVNSSTKSNITLGQPAIGTSLTSTRISDLGFWSQLLLPPQSPKVTATQGDYPDRVHISWNFDPLSSQPTEGFIIERDGAFLVKVEPELSQFIDFNVQAGENYIYTVKGVNDFGTGNGGSSIGFINPNGVVSGRVTTRNGVPVEGATIKLSPISGTSLLFDGVNDYVCLSYKNTLPTNIWTISAWVKLDTVGNANKGIIDFGSDVNKNMWLKTNTTSKGVTAGFDNGTSDLEISKTFPSQVNGWHHISMVYGGGTMILYVDAEYAGAVKGSISNQNLLFTIGSLRNNTNFFKGNIDDVRIYNRMLTQSEIMSTLDITASRSTNGLRGYWKFDEGVGEKVFDISTSDIDGYLHGATFSSTIPAISNGAVTDNGGFYTIDAINYSSEQSFMATPSKNFYKNYALEFNAVNASRADLVNFDLPEKSTIEVLVHPFNKTDQQSILYKKGSGSNAHHFQLLISNNNYYLLLNNSASQLLGPVGNGYDHIALALDGTVNTVKYYLNGTLQKTLTYADVDANWTANNWQLGYVNTTDNKQYYTGLIDEVAFFDTLLSSNVIQLHASTALTAGVDTGDDHLLSYFSLNEGLGTIIDDFGTLTTISGTVTNATFSPNAFRYEEIGHEFSPSVRQVNINASNTAVSMIDFTDVSTIPISGVIRFENTFCFNKEVEILVNGNSHNPPIFTDEDGRFLAEFDPGVSVMLSPVFQDHTFFPAFFEARTLLNPIAGVLFQNKTKRTLEGQVWGGKCKLPILTGVSDKVILELRADNDCYVRRDTVKASDNGVYSFTNIPPIEYSIGIADGSTTSIFDYFENIGGSPVDLRFVEKDTINFEYRSSPEVEISGIENHMCDMGNINYPLLVAGTLYTSKIKVYEPYLDQRCYLDTATVNVTNNVADEGQKTYEMTNGEKVIEYTAGFPNFISPHLKTLSVDIETTDGRTADASKDMVVTGAKKLPAAVLSTNPPIYPFYILRDPPGDGSFATIEKNQQVCREFNLSGTFTLSTGGSATIGSNITVPPFLGIKNGSASFTAGYNYTRTVENERGAELCVSLTESISTPESDEYIGSDGDTYIGATLNVRYGANVDLVIDSVCILKVDTVYSLNLDGFESQFVYTEKHIRENVIPLAQQVGDLYTATRWRDLINRNQELKDNALEPADLSIKVNGSNVPSSDINLTTLTDRDNDGRPDSEDPCPWHIENADCGYDFDLDGYKDRNFSGKIDDDNCPYTHNPYQQDTDGDGIGDACDSDIDNDGIDNNIDNCDFYENHEQVDENGDGVGDVCANSNDLDYDGITDFSDNCPYTPNNDQFDFDKDGIGDACEADTDQDGILNDYDKCPLVVGDKCNTDSNIDDELTLGDVRKNITFSAGSSYSSSWAQDTVTSVSNAITKDHALAISFEITVGDVDKGPLYGIVNGNIDFDWGHGQYEANNKTSSTIVSYTLADDDPGDFFTVDILSDPRYKTPVFNLLGGDSSCPYASDTTRNRDGVNFSIDRNSATNVGENDKAVFYLNIGNVSATSETRTYIVKPVAESNPDGASILIGGQSEQILAIPAGKQIKMVMTIEKGPVEFDYDSLRIAMYAECEYDQSAAVDGALDPRFYKEVVVDVQFVEGCGEVEVAFPNQGWVVTDPNPLTSKLTLQLSDYDETDPDLIEIKTQYRLVGGSGIWINIDTISKANLGPTNTYSDWFIKNLADADYEVRAVTFCTGGLAPGSSEFIRGRVERNPPELFGVPEPADGVLSLGDEISITFNEDIRCNEIFQADGIGTNINWNNLGLFDLTAGRLIDADITCLDNKIIIVPIGNNKFIENHTLKVITNNIKDLAGNASAEISWEFYVNRSNLYWAGTAINERVIEGNSKQIKREIRNQGGVFTSFQMQDLPSWIDVFPKEGTVAPGGIQDVLFTVPNNLVNGFYNTNIILHPTDGSGDEPLETKIRVICPEPEWELDPADFDFSMNMTLQINIEGILSTDELDKVGAFVDGQLRGIAYIQYREDINKYFAFLTVYSDLAVGEIITFQIWDASECQLYGATSETFPFVTDDLIGSPLTPQVIHTNNLLLKKIYFHPGWNWFSHNVELPNDSIHIALSSLTNPDEGLLKSQSNFVQYYEPTWYGDLERLSHLTMHQYKNDNYDSLILVGHPIDPTTPINLTTGWNWISYLPQIGLPIDSALYSLSPSNGDIVKSQLTFAQYVAGFGWIGNLEYMSSPNGYQIKLANADVLSYPAYTPPSIIGNGETSKMYRDKNTISMDYQKQEIDQTQSSSSLSHHWKVSPEKFEYSMNMIAIVTSSEIQNMLHKDDEVGAFIRGELRGSGKAIYIANLDVYMVFVTVYANIEGELVSFKYYNAAQDKEYDLTEKVAFRVNAVEGNIANPHVLSLMTTSTSDLSMSSNKLQIYPNPFSSQIYVEYHSEMNEVASITIKDMLGNEIDAKEVKLNIGNNILEWKPKSNTSYGSYFLSLETSREILTRKILYIR